jgi:hypothetical protein
VGGIISWLVLIVAGYFEYQRRRRKAILQRFALQRLKRKFKLNEGLSCRPSAAKGQGRIGQSLIIERTPAVHDDLIASGQQQQHQTLRKSAWDMSKVTTLRPRRAKD